MPDYPFLSTFVQGRLAGLLSKSELAELAQAQGFEALIAGLERDKAERFEKMAHRRGTLESFVKAVAHEHSKALREVFAFARPEEADTYLGHLQALFELDDVKTLVRGFTRGADLKKVRRRLSGLLPLKDDQLEELFGQIGGDFYAGLARLPLHPFLQHGLKRIDASLPPIRIEQLLEKTLFEDIRKALATRPEPALAFVIATEIDIRNIRLALHFVGTPDGPEVRSYCLEGGHLDRAFYDQLFAQSSIDDVVEALTRTSYGPTIQKGVIIYASLGTVLVFDRLFDEAMLLELTKHALVEPLSLWPTLLYLYRLRNEKKNLNVLLRLKFHNFPTGTIREMLVHA